MKKNSLHAMLLLRLGLVTVLMSAAVAYVAVRTESASVRRVAADRALIRLGTLRSLILKQLDGPAPLDPAVTGAMLKAVGYKGYDLGTGHYVLLRVIGPSSAEVARVADAAHDGLPDLAAYVAASAYRRPSDAIETDRLKLSGRDYIRVSVPLRNSAGRPAAYAEGYFAASPEEKKAARRQLLMAVSLAVGMVLATTLLLYPVILRLLLRLGSLSQRLLESNLEVLGLLGSAIAKRDSDTDLHNYRVTLYSVRIAERLGLDNAAIRLLIMGAFLHDVGKIGVRDAILLKPGRLTPEEFAEMKLHVKHGVDIVSRSAWTGAALPVVESHHEKIDGAGYPAGKKGSGIPLPARIFAIADVFDALTSRRPYKEAFSYEDSVAILKEGRGQHFDPEALDAFLYIARPLYDQYANKESEAPRIEVDNLIRRYFRSDISVYLD